MPHLLARLAQEPLRAPAIGRAQCPVEQATGRVLGQGAVLGGDPARENAVDALVVPAPPVDDTRVREVVVGDHGQQRLRQVVVDVRVDPEQDVDQWRGRRRRVEGQTPRPWDAAVAGEVGIQRVEVQLREGDVPRLDPGRVLEHRAVDRGRDRLRRAPVGAQELGLRRMPGRHGVEPLLHRVQHAGDRRRPVRLVDWPCTAPWDGWLLRAILGPGTASCQPRHRATPEVVGTAAGRAVDLHATSQAQHTPGRPHPRLHPWPVAVHRPLPAGRLRPALPLPGAHGAPVRLADPGHPDPDGAGLGVPRRVLVLRLCAA